MHVPLLMLLYASGPAKKGRVSIRILFSFATTSPGRYFLRQILKTGAKLGHFFAIFGNSVCSHVQHVHTHFHLGVHVPQVSGLWGTS